MEKIIKTTLEKIISPVKNSLISGPFGSNISSKYFVDSGIPVIRGNNLSLSYDKFYDSGFVYVTKEKADELKCDALPGDLIFTSAGTLGQVGLITDNTKYKRYVISNKQIRARIDTAKVNNLYAYYWFSSKWIQNYLNNNNKGSTVPLLTLNEVKNLPIYYPENIKQQEKIANFLDLISNIIENNNKFLNELEKIIKTTYLYWFVQFDFPDEKGHPYKSSGGKMVYNNILNKEIPVGWKVVRLKELVEKCNTEVFDYSSQVDTVDLSIMPSGSINLNELNDSNNFSTNLYFMKKGTFLFGSIRPYLKKAVIAPCDGAVAGTVHSFKTKNDINYNFILGTIINDFFFNYAVQISKGTKMPVVGFDDLLEYPVAYNETIVEKFNSHDYKSIICDKIMENIKYNKMRDNFAPLLMDGTLYFE